MCRSALNQSINHQRNQWTQKSKVQIDKRWVKYELVRWFIVSPVPIWTLGKIRAHLNCKYNCLMTWMKWGWNKRKIKLRWLPTTKETDREKMSFQLSQEERKVDCSEDWWWILGVQIQKKWHDHSVVGRLFLKKGEEWQKNLIDILRILGIWNETN